MNTSSCIINFQLLYFVNISHFICFTERTSRKRNFDEMMKAERVNGEIYNLVEQLLMNQPARPDDEEEMKREPSLPATSREQPVRRQTRTAQSNISTSPATPTTSTVVEQDNQYLAEMLADIDYDSVDF